MSDNTPNKVTWAWIENTVGPEGYVEYFECACGNDVINGNERHVEVHGCGRDELEVIHCDHCNTTWRSKWTGITFERDEEQ